MCSGPAKPVILISYSHKDEPDRAPEGEVYWLTYVQSYLALAVREANGTFELWTDKDIVVGTNWRAGIEAKLAACSICILWCLAIRSTRNSCSRWRSKRSVSGNGKVAGSRFVRSCFRRFQTKGYRRGYAISNCGRVPISRYQDCAARSGKQRWRTSSTKLSASQRGRRADSTTTGRAGKAAGLCPHHGTAGNAVCEPRRARCGADAARRGVGRSGHQYNLARRGGRVRQIGARQRMAEAAAGRQLPRRRHGARLVVLQPGHERPGNLGRRLSRLGLGPARRHAGGDDDSPPKPEPPDPAERDRLLAEAAEQLRIAAGFIESCGYHRRDEELAELQAVLRGERPFASLPPRV
jgi:hypothetical protein